MIETARRHPTSKDYLILILDKSSLKVFSSCCKFFDVYKANLYHIEKLEVKRKRFPKTDAIYFISPTQEAISHLIEDFKDDKEPSKLQYNGVHLCFTSHVNEDLMK
jgi:syntaxin-binding protein 1